MAASSKRSLPSKVEAMKARKRTKLMPLEKSSHTKEKSSKRQLDDLQWTDVSLPDRMDDYEGFLGLQEVEGVEVLKDDQSGTLQYYAKQPKQNFSSTKVSNGNSEEAAHQNEWTGFEDEGSGSRPMKQSKIAKKQDRPIPEPATATNPSKNKNRSSIGAKTVAKSAFGALEDDSGSAGGDVSAWLSLKLSPDIMAALSRLNFTKPTAIQASSIPAIMAGQDVIGKASTGSGKTLAFGIPLIEKFLEEQGGTKSPDETCCVALILSPTRELAHQIEQHLLALCSGLFDNAPYVVCLTGGLSVQKQQRQLKTAHIIVATPGRLWELVGAEKGLGKVLQGIRYLVIDEADRLLSEGHFKEVEEILNVLDRQDDDVSTELPSAVTDVESIKPKQRPSARRQTLVFSATFDKGLQKKLLGKSRPGGDLLSNKDSMAYLLSKLNFHNEPQFVDVNPVKQLATGLKEGLIECGGMEKDLYLYSILLHHPKSRVMVFTNSISAVRRITPFLQNLNLPVLALHSGMPQKARLRSVERLAEASAQNKGGILVATDVAARGLDIPNVQLVVHYHLPRAADMYVHRSGRTARAGQQGSSIIICSPEEASGVRKLVAKVHAQYAGSRDLSASQAAKQGYYIRTMDPDRKIVARLKPRAALAKKLADITIAKEKQHKEDEFLHAAAEELGVDYDSDEFQKQAPGRSGRGSGRKQKEKQAQGISKAETAALRAELKALLESRINVGVSETYITSGRVDVAELLHQQETGQKTAEFLGTSSGFHLDDA